MFDKKLSLKTTVSYIKNSGYYFFSSLLVAIIGVLLNPLFARYLSHDDYAVLGYFSSFNFLLMPLLHYSLFQYYTRQYYFIPENEREKLGNTIFCGANIVGLIALTLFMIIFSFLYNLKAQKSFSFFPYAILIYSQLYIGNIISFYKIQLRIKRKAKRFAIYSILSCLVTSFLSVFFVVVLKNGAEGKLIGTLLATIIIALYSLKYVCSNFKIDIVELKKALKFCTPLTISALFWYGLNGVDRLFLEPLGNNVELGLYNIGLSIAGYLTIFHTTLSSTFEPDIYQAISTNNVKKIIFYIILIVGAVAFFNILFIALAPYIIGILTAYRYNDAAPYARILALHNIVLSLYYIVVTLLVGYGYTKLELGIRVLGALLSAISYYIFIKFWQFYGAAWGQVWSFLLLSLMGIGVFILKKNRKIV